MQSHSCIVWKLCDPWPCQSQSGHIGTAHLACRSHLDKWSPLGPLMGQEQGVQALIARRRMVPPPYIIPDLGWICCYNDSTCNIQCYSAPIFWIHKIMFTSFITVILHNKANINAYICLQPVVHIYSSGIMLCILFFIYTPLSFIWQHKVSCAVTKALDFQMQF